MQRAASMVVRLSDIRSKTGKIFLCFLPVLDLTSDNLTKLSQINALCINLSYSPKDQSLKFLQKILRIGGFEKFRFFESAILIFFCFIPMKISYKLCDRMDGTQFLWLSWFSAKTDPPQTLTAKSRFYLVIHLFLWVSTKSQVSLKETHISTQIWQVCSWSDSRQKSSKLLRWIQTV